MAPILLFALFSPGLAPAKPDPCAQNFASLDYGAIKKKVEGSSFTTSRDYLDYVRTFGDKFRAAAQALGPGDAWVDFGSGRGFAALRFLARFKDPSRAPKVYGLTFQRPTFFDPVWDQDNAWVKKRARWYESMDKKFREQNKFIPLEGKYVEDAPVPEFKLGTDLFGPLSYTNDIPKVLGKYLSGMTPGKSELYVHLTKTRPMDEVGTTIITPEGMSLSLTEWLKSFDGLSVETVAQNEWALSLRITTNGKPVVLPELELLEFSQRNPPMRIFQVRAAK